MVLAIEPVHGYWHLQDMIVVRRGAPELLSSRLSTDSMFAVEV